jgi:hypothetical protein
LRSARRAFGGRVADHKFLFVSAQNGVLISDGAQSRELLSESSPMLPA